MSDENNNNDPKETIENLKEEAKNTVNEIKEGWNEVTNSGENKKVLAGILGILLGGFGIHKFYLGYNKEGLIQLVITFVTCGAASIVGFIEGIIYLTKTDDEFYQTYQVGKKPWF